MAPTSAPAAIDLMDLAIYSENREDAVWEDLRASDPVHHQEANENGPAFWSLLRYDDVRDGAADNARLSSAAGTQIFDRKVEGHGRASIHNMDDPEHAELRKIALPYLRAVKIQQWNEVIRSTVETLLDRAEDGRRFDLLTDISSQLPLLVLAQVMGVPSEDAQKMVDWTNRLTSSDPDDRVDAAALAATQDEVLDYFHWLTDDRRANPRNDLVSILVQGEKNGKPLSWEELAAYYIVVVAAGNETTRHLVSGTTIALAENPGTWRRVLADEGLLPTLVEEAFRYVSPLAGMRRTALEDLEIRGQRISAGEKVVLWFGAANRDPEVFDDPQRFDITRNPNEHLTFGWGVHFCLGTHLARAEVRAYFAEQRRRRIDFELDGDPVRLRNNIFRGWTSVPVRAVVR